MFILRQTSVKIAVLLHKQAKVPFVLDLAVHILKLIQRNIYHSLYDLNPTLWEGFYEGYRLWLISTNCWTCLTNIISIKIGLNRGAKWWFWGYYMGSRLWLVSTNCWCLNTKIRFCTPTLGLQIPSSNDSKMSRNRGTNFSYLICQSWYYPWFFFVETRICTPIIRANLYQS